MRSLWPAVLPDAAHVRTAYALDSSTQEIVYVAGPALAVAVATWLSPAWALALAAAAALVSSVVFATARPARAWRAVTRRPGPLGVLRPPAMRLLLCALVFLGGTVGALDVASIAVAGRQDTPWLAGALPAVFSAAGLLGGVLFARLQPATAPQPRHLLLVAALFAAGWLPLLASLPAPAVLAAAVLPGALFVPLLTVASPTTPPTSPPGRRSGELRLRTAWRSAADSRACRTPAPRERPAHAGPARRGARQPEPTAAQPAHHRDQGDAACPTPTASTPCPARTTIPGCPTLADPGC
ncbi:hypothetical protein ABT272_41965 [Streptomyces sp900105245]|uniref:MFS transporter n=1 Tax=Streptomyces sp. 900105245 TaxID=3154379 RepID=A0ABV1UKJ1_9ACTN